MLGQRPRLDNIMSTFNDTIDDLQALEAHHALKHGENQTKIAVLAQDSEALIAEAAKANGIRQKIEALVS